MRATCTHDSNDMTLLVGRFPPEPLGRRRVFLARNQHSGIIEAFVVTNPMKDGASWALETFRKRPEATRGSMPFLLKEVLEVNAQLLVRMQCGDCLQPVFLLGGQRRPSVLAALLAESRKPCCVVACHPRLAVASRQSHRHRHGRSRPAFEGQNYNPHPPGSISVLLTAFNLLEFRQRQMQLHVPGHLPVQDTEASCQAVWESVREGPLPTIREGLCQTVTRSLERLRADFDPADGEGDGLFGTDDKVVAPHL